MNETEIGGPRVTPKRSKVLLKPLLFTLLVPGLLSGCVKLNAEFVVNEDDTISGSIVFAVWQELSALSGATFTEVELAPPSLGGITIEPYEDAFYIGEVYRYPAVSFDTFAGAALYEDAFKVERDGDFVIATGVWDLTSEALGTYGPDDPFGLGEAVLAGSDIYLSVQFPGEIRETNGLVDYSTNTVTWFPTIGERSVIRAVVYSPAVVPIWVWSWIVVGVLTLAGAVILVIGLRRRNRSLVEPGFGAPTPEILSSGSDGPQNENLLKIQRLAELRAQGVLTEIEFEEKKRDIIDRL